MRVYERDASGPGVVELVVELPSDVGLIEKAVAYLADRCRDRGFRGSRLELNFRVGVTEALSNAILYGNQRSRTKRVRVEARIDHHAVDVRVSDEGRGFEPELLPDPTRPENIGRPYGRGVFLLRNLMDEVEFSDQGSVVRFVLLRDER